PKKQNTIIFIALDTLRGDQIGAGTGNQSLTPNIDRFISDSVYFENTYAQTSWTLPSFMSLFTALYEYNHNVGIKNSLSLEKPFLIKELSQKFITFGLHGGKVMNSRWGYWQGFDYYKHFRFASALYPRGGQSLFKKAAQLLETSRFPHLFLFLHTYQVHAPYTPPEEFLQKLNPDPKYKNLEAVNYNNPAKTYLPAEEDQTNALKELYQAEILAFDSYFGEFIDRLKEMNLYENAMIVFMSDHGEEFFEHKGWGHSHNLYDELIKVPVIIKFPGNQFKNIRLTDAVGVIDIMPTILGFYRINFDARKLDGRDLMPLIREGKKRSPGYVVSSISTGRYFEAVPPRIALLFDHYKLVYNEPFSPKDLAFFKDFPSPPQPPLFELYNLKEDPGEINDISPTHPELKKKMMPIILEIVKQVKQKIAAGEKKNRPLDKEVEDQLKSLGYL
ncbi:MAG: sulfatase-like hydrolase/transferase, partial [bacterium]|nr:sulfatase-like hydrolase/transferase [bacterium]